MHIQLIYIIKPYAIYSNKTGQDIEAVLLELGHPKDLADKYRGAKKYLIGPEPFAILDHFIKWIHKIG